MSIFSDLLRPPDIENTYLENYFTKIVVHLLNTFPEILYTWLKDLQLIDDTNEYRNAIVQRQQPYHRLPHHQKASIVDIQVKLQQNKSQCDLIFVEAKIDALGDLDQLQRYAEHLDRQDAGKKILLYITRRDFPIFYQNQVLQRIPNSRVIFEHINWRTFHQVLQVQPKNTLVDEVIAFMFEKEMGPNKNLTREYGPDLSGLHLSGAGLQGVTLPKSNLQGTNLSGADLSGAILSEANLQDANLSNAKLWGADLTGANLYGADLGEADLHKTSLRRVEIDETTKIDNEWRLIWEIVNHRVPSQNLQAANLSEMDLQDIDLSWYDMRGINLSGSNLNGAGLRYATMLEANLYMAQLNGADLRGAGLQKANLSKANLCNADLRWADLAGANLREANLTGANLVGAKHDDQTQWPDGFTLAEDLK